METKAVVYKTWDDLVFENRNKAYGAYALRRSYNNQVLLGFGVSIALISLLFLIPRGEGLPKPIAAKPERVITISDPPIFEPRLPQRRRLSQSQQQPRTVQTANLIPIITHEEVVPAEDVAPPAEPEFVDNNGTEDGVDFDGETGGNGTSAPPIDLTNTTFVFAEEMPAYRGGMEAMVHFLSRNLKYPSSARRMTMQGTVYVSFVVKSDSTVSDVQVLRGFHPECDKEAMRVVAAMPDWISGKQSKIPVNVKMVLPIKFVLHD